MVLSYERGACPFQTRGELLVQVEDFNGLRGFVHE